MTAKVVWRPSVENGNAAMVAVAANAMAESGRGDHSDSRRGVMGSSSDVIENHRSTGESWSNTSPNNDGGDGGGGGGGGEKNRHTPSSSRRWTAILTDCTDSHGGVLNVTLLMIGRTMMRAAGGGAPTTTAATATMQLGTAAT